MSPDVEVGSPCVSTTWPDFEAIFHGEADSSGTFLAVTTPVAEGVVAAKELSRLQGRNDTMGGAVVSLSKRSSPVVWRTGHDGQGAHSDVA